MPRPSFAALLVTAASLTLTHAGVVRLDLDDRAPVLNGQAFGAAGPYERLRGKAVLAVDPKLPVNARITDLALAPRNSQGLVEFAADVYILRPTDLAKGNGTVLFEVPNRGNKGLFSMFCRARSGAAPVTADTLGDALLLRQGYTIVWVGWQTDTPPGPDKMRLYAPAARGVQGLVRSEYTPDHPVDLIPLADASHIPYTIDTSAPVTVTEREGVEGHRRTVPPSAWTLDKEAVRLHTPAIPGHIYEVIYTSSNPPVAGLGPAAIRDVIAYLKREHKYAIGFGVSQSAMLLRGFLYEGFNQGEDGRKVFDGVFAHVAGARRSTFHRLVQLSRTAGPLRNGSLSTTEQFPFADLDQKDHLTGRVDGILHRARAANVVPKIFYTNSAYEYWGSGASLTHTTTDGRRDHPVPPTTRIYLFAGGQHGPASFPPARGRGQNLANFNDYKWPMRALLAHLQAWVAEDQTPPPSSYPTLAAGTLAPLAQYRFPALAGITLPTRIHTPARLDFGKNYATTGIVTVEPPRILGHWTPLVPQAGPDGNDLAGIRMPEVACSLGAFTGWNLRSAAAGASGTLLANTGSFIALQTPLRPDYEDCVGREALDLTDRTLLLPADTAAVRDASLHHATLVKNEQQTRSGRPVRTP